ncbi:MAG: hypothetical protein HZB79_03555, partial [Deltaproteobacteria bacterium]|nr:hypothetical protein [Deltaproteobacteria bacterium]
TKTVTFTFIPNTGITVKTSAPVYSYTAPKIPEAKAAEAKKEEVKEKAGTAVITIRAPKDGLLTKDDVILEYTVEGAEKVEGDASGTIYTKEGAYTKTITAIDKQGGKTTQKITWTIDKTPPEAIISYDIYNMDILVSGADNVTKDVIVTKSETGYTYFLTDEAGNMLSILFEKLDRGVNKLEASIGILIYNGIGIIPNENTISITVNVDKKTGAVKNITQTYRSKNIWKIVLDYDKKKNTTKVTTGDDKDIKAKDKKKDKTASSSGSGIKVIKILTKSGELSYGY